MKLMIRSLLTTSLLIASSSLWAQVKCSSPMTIEIYDEASRQAAGFLKSKIRSGSIADIKVENIVNDQYGYPRKRLPYVHSRATIFGRKGIDDVCVANTVRSLKIMGFKKDEIAFRPYASNSKSFALRVSIPPRTFLYEYDGILTINP